MFRALVVVAMVFMATPLVRASFAQQSKAEAAFIHARELFDEENWTAAAAKFEEFLALYPQDKNVPAAYYWLAMTLKKQTKYAEADERLARLLNEFPNSSWANDARALRVEIAGLTNNEAIVVQAASDENESVRLAALQSLLRLNPERAFTMIADVLRPDSKASSNMKLSVVTLLGRGAGKAAVPLLTQVVNEQTVTQLRVRAIYALAQIDDPSAFDVLKAAGSSEDQQVAKAALFALAQLPGDSSQSRLWEIAQQQDGSVELRSQAILALGQRGELQSLNKLIQLYDQERNEDVKRWIILALAPSNEKTVTRKLMTIAKSDQSPRLRHWALLSLQRSSDPEVRKFLQEMERTGSEGKE